MRDKVNGFVRIRTGSSKEVEISKAIIEYKGKAAGILEETDFDYLPNYQ